MLVRYGVSPGKPFFSHIFKWMAPIPADWIEFYGGIIMHLMAMPSSELVHRPLAALGYDAESIFFTSQWTRAKARRAHPSGPHVTP